MMLLFVGCDQLIISSFTHIAATMGMEIRRKGLYEMDSLSLPWSKACNAR